MVSSRTAGCFMGVSRDCGEEEGAQPRVEQSAVRCACDRSKSPCAPIRRVPESTSSMYAYQLRDTPPKSP